MNPIVHHSSNDSCRTLLVPMKSMALFALKIQIMLVALMSLTAPKAPMGLEVLMTPTSIMCRVALMAIWLSML